MSSERLAKCLADIVAAADLVGEWAARAGGAKQAVTADKLMRSAIERQLLIISEAAVRLNKLDPAAAPRLAPDIDWPGVRGIGNFVRHSYDDLDTGIVIDVLENRLTPLREACVAALRAVQGDDRGVR